MREIKISSMHNSIRAVAIERDGRKILVEIKSFSGRSSICELQQAIGQYRMYVDVVELTELGYEVYLTARTFIE